MPEICCPKSVKACAVRVTALDFAGLPLDPLVIDSRIQGAAFAELGLSPDYLAGAEVVVRTPGGNVAVIDTDPNVLKGFNLNLKLCGMPAFFSFMLNAESLVNDGRAEGAVLRDEIASPCQAQFMLELWSKNVGYDDCDGLSVPSDRFVHWVLPLTSQWTLGGDLNFQSGPLDLSVKGYAVANPWWYPSYPGATFASYVSGFPSGPPPAVLPEGVLADSWTLDDLTRIRAGGPLGWKCVSALPEPLSDCEFVAGSLVASA